MSDIDKVINALRRSYLYGVNCELTEAQSKKLLDYIAELNETVEKLETAYGILQDECSTLYRHNDSDGTLPPEEREE